MSASPNPTAQPARTEIPVNVDVQSSDDDLATALHEGAESGGLDERMCAVVLDRLQALLAEVGEVTALRQQVEQLKCELEELREATFPKSWAGFKAFIDEVYPDDIFPDDDRDLGPQFVVAARRLTEATLERDALQARLDAVLAECDQLERGANEAEARIDGQVSFVAMTTRECVSTVRTAARGGQE